MTEPGPQGVTVLMPTLGRPERRAHISRALASILQQQGVDATACVIINGQEADPRLAAELSAMPGVEVVVIPAAGIPGALLAGRRRVRTTYFGALDDDDELLPGALAARVAALEADPALDAVVTDGILRSGAGDRRLREDFTEVRRDPLREMFRSNWLLPGSWLCRTDRVGTWLFEDMPVHRECTWIGLRLATRSPLAFLTDVTVCYHEDSPGGEHRTLAYATAQPDAIQRFRELPLPPDLQERLRRSLAPAYHHVSHRLLLGEGSRLEAWRWHLRALLAPSGLRHLFFTRKLLWPRRWLRRLQAPGPARPPTAG